MKIDTFVKSALIDELDNFVKLGFSVKIDTLCEIEAGNYGQMEVFSRN